MVNFYYLKFEVVSSSKDALIVNNIYGQSEHCGFVWYSLEKMMYCIYKGKIYSQGVIINSLII